MRSQSLARSLLIRGMLTGLVAGVVAFVVARLVGESQVNAAIAVEAAHAAAEPAGHAHDAESISRGVQSTIGLLTATTLYGVGLGGLFSLVFAGTLGRLGRFGARTLAGLIALGGFVTLTLVPYLKYPPNPPAVGNHDTIGSRTALFFSLMAISVALAVLAVWSGRRLAPALGRWNATIAAVAGYAVAVALCMWALPVVQEVEPDFPAVTLYAFRIASLGVQVSVWATLGLVFGVLADRLLAPRTARLPAADRVAV